MKWALILSIVIAADLAATAAFGQEEPQQGQAGGQGQAPPPVIIINTAPPPPERDPCEPLNTRLNKERCDSVIGSSRAIDLDPGESRILHFDRPFKVIYLDNPDPKNPVADIGSKNANLDTDSSLEIRAHHRGTANIVVLGEGSIKQGQIAVRDVMMSATIRVSQEPSYRIKVIDGSKGFNTRNYGCGRTGCDFIPARR